MISPTASRRSHSPVKHKAHELQVEGAGQAEQPDLPRGILLALTSLTKITIVPF